MWDKVEKFVDKNLPEKDATRASELFDENQLNIIRNSELKKK